MYLKVERTLVGKVRIYLAEGEVNTHLYLTLEEAETLAHALRTEVQDIRAATNTCRDCGEVGKITGHMDCQYPGRYSDPRQ